MTVLEALALGLTVGALVVYAWAEPKLSEQDDTIGDLREQLEDTEAERDGFRMHLDGVIDCELGQPDSRERAIAYHPAGGRRGTWQPQEDRAVRDHLKLVSGGQP